MERNTTSEASEKPRLSERELFAAADTMRGSMEPSDYKHVALGLLFLKHISDSFEARHLEFEQQYAEAVGSKNPPTEEEERDFCKEENVFWVPKEARWQHIMGNARQPHIGKIVNQAMLAIEDDNDSLKGVLPKDYTREAISPIMLGNLVDFGADREEARDYLGRVYEYFLSEFAGSEGKRGGEFYTPREVVRILVEMLEPYKGRVYDPCCGSGGMFVSSEAFVEEHGGRRDSLAIYGQEMNNTTWRLAKMNLAIRGIEGDVRWNGEGSFLSDAFLTEKFDFILANPPFNVTGWGARKLDGDPRFTYGMPGDGNANYAWLQHILHHLSHRNGTAGVVLANGSMSSEQSQEGAIRRKMLEDDVIDCMVALPGQLFYSTQIPVCLWLLAKNKKNGRFTNRMGKVLFIDARKMGFMKDRTHRGFHEEEIRKIADTYHHWREGKDYEDVPGFCKSASMKEIEEAGFVLTPGRYVGSEKQAEDPTPFPEKFAALQAELDAQFTQSAALTRKVKAQLKKLGVKG